MPFRCESELIKAFQRRNSTHGLSRSPASGPDRSGTGVVATFHLQFQERHGHEELAVGIVPKYNALPFLVEETFERRVDLIQVAHSLLTCRADRVDVEPRKAEMPAGHCIRWFGKNNLRCPFPFSVFSLLRTDCRHPLSCGVNEFMPCSPKWNLCLSSFGRFLNPQIWLVRHNCHSRSYRNYPINLPLRRCRST